MRDILEQIKREMGASNLDDAEFLDNAEFFDSLSAEDIDNLDDAEYAEYMDYLDSLEMAEKRHGKGKVRLAKFKAKRNRGAGGKKQKQLGPKRDKMVAVGGGGAYAKPGTYNASPPPFGDASYIQQMMTRSKGDLNITVTRQSINIVQTLPYILFGLNGYQSSYISTIKNYLPAGVTMAASVDSATGDILLTYTAAGPLVDIIRISLTGSQISYSEFLQSMNSNFFKTDYIRQEYVNNSVLLSAVSQTINFGLLSALGMKNANGLLPRSRRLTADFNTNIVNLFIPEQKVTSDFSFVQGMTANAGQVIAWDVFMSGRVNLNNM